MIWDEWIRIYISHLQQVTIQAKNTFDYLKFQEYLSLEISLYKIPNISDKITDMYFEAKLNWSYTIK